ncbi:MAG: terpene cyclase/mutase family protein [Actinomycetota bacterium]|nr:terpene cyclase/mutase family protein [Actinomycetota bacterium]
MEPVIAWLTETNDPYVGYLTRKNILGEKINKKNSPEIIDNIAKREPVSTILSMQNREGWWGLDNYSFNPLYKNTFWQLYFLSMMGITKRVGGIDKAVSLVVGHIQKDNGSFRPDSGYSATLCCMQGISLEMLLRLGYTDNDFTKKGIDYINNMVYRESFRCKYRQNLRCPWGAIKILKAYNLIPDKYIDEKMKSTRKKALDFLVKYDIVEAAYPRKKNKSNHWLMFGFPRSYHSDILELVSAVVDAGCGGDSRNVKRALDYILSKRLPDGTWKMEYSLNGRMLVNIEKKNKPSKWITYLALKTLYKSRYLEKKE